jgi:phosphonate transport system substrate-binding protein
LIYANPFDASMILRDKGFVPSRRPGATGRGAHRGAGGPPGPEGHRTPRGLRIASTDDPDVRTICMILVEPADITAADIDMKTVDSYVLVAKELLNGGAEAGFFLEDAYQQLSSVVTGQLRPIGQPIHVVRHVLLAGPKLEGIDSRLAARRSSR